VRWLITGGCGFIGRSLVQDLVAEGGHVVRVLDDLSVGTREELAAICEAREMHAGAPDPPMEPYGVELVVGSVQDGGLVQRVARGMDVFVHLAARTGVASSVADPRDDCLTNVIGTLNCLDAARAVGTVRRFVFASSGASVGECAPPIHEDVAPRPVSPYGAGKLAGEGYCSAYFHTFGIETVALRFGNVYGPRSGHKSSVVAGFIRSAMAAEPLEIHGDGGQTRDFIFVGDLVRAIRLAATAPGAAGEVFQIATSAETTVTDLVAQLVPALHEAGLAAVDVVHGPARPGDVRRSVSDTQKAARILGWTAEVVLADGLRRTVEWFLERPERGLPPLAE
jgi:UDP-glucose 4-epimerase